MSIDALLTHFDRLIQTPEAVSRLRRFILDLAVRGKLVPQDPADEPAAELLKRIAAEKAGGLKKPKRFRHTTKTPYSLPPSWCWTRIREITSDRGQCIPKAAFTYIDVTAIDKGNGVISGPKVLQAAEAPSRARKVVQKGDVVYSCVRPYLLNVAIVDKDFEPKPIASTAFAILNGHGLVLPRYLWIVLRSPFMVVCVEENMRGQAYPAINDSDFSVLPFPLPPLTEQRRIVAKVDELMGLCDRLEAAQAERETTRSRLAAASLARLNAPDPDQATFRQHVAFALDHFTPLTTHPGQVKALRQTILNLAVRGKLVPQDPSDEPAAELLKRIAAEKARLVRTGRIRQAKPLPSIDPDPLLFVEPPGWTQAHLLEISRKIHYGFTASAIKENKNIRLLRITDIQNNKVDWNGVPGCEIDEETLPNFKLETGDILIARTGTVGKSFLVTELPRVSVFASYLIRVQPSEEICIRYLKLFLESPVYWSQLKKGARGTVQPNINGRTLGKMIVPLPPLAEQRRIVAKVDELMGLCTGLEAILAAGEDAGGRLVNAVLYEALEPHRNHTQLAVN